MRHYIQYMVALFVLNLDELSKVKATDKNIKCKCEECGREFIIKNGKTARRKCKANDKLLCRQCSMMKTSMAKYGVKNPGCSKEALEKIKKTNLERRGVECSFASKSVIEKIHKTKEDNGTLKPKTKVKHTDEFKAKQSERAKEVKPWKYHTEQSKKKMSEASKMYWSGLSDEEKHQIREKSRHRYMYEDGQKFDSSWELALWIYALDHNEPIEREPTEIKYDNHICYPDFRYNGKLVEVKGPQFFEDGKMVNPFDRSQDDAYEAKHQAMLANGVEFISSKEDIKFALDYVAQTYSDDFLHLFDTHLSFPYPNEDLADTTDIGLINHFHKSIWRASKQGQMSPYDAFMLKRDFREMALNRLRYAKSCKPEDILRAYNVTMKHQRVSVFKPSLAKKLIDKYLSDANTIVDPFSGFSGRLLGAFNCGKAYFGKDLNEEHVKESNEIISYKRMDGCSVAVEDILKKEDVESYDALLTCPPYNDKEFWTSNKSEVCKTCDEWIDICLQKYKCKKYLFVVDETDRDFVDIIETKTLYGSRKEKIVYITI